MSGPKVVRIVTRDEVVAICRGLLARVDAALEDWIRIGERNECLGSDAIAEARRRREALSALLAADRFMDLQKQAPVEEAFLRADIQEQLASVAAEKTAARARERRNADAAAALLRSLRASGREVGSDLEKALLSAAEGRPDGKAMAAGFALLSDDGRERSERIREHAERLREGSDAPTYADWMASLPRSPSEAAIERLDGYIVSIGQIAPDENVAIWSDRLRQAAHETEDGRRNLIIDDLETRISRRLKEIRELSKAREELAALRREIAAAGGIESATTHGDSNYDIVTLQAEIAAGRAELDRIRSTNDAEARRSAVLEGLLGLGYEVTEGMSTSWALEGHVVLRKAASPDYGVELAGNPDAGRLQMRAVAFENGRAGPDPRRDVDAETIWCGDVGQLGERLAGLGGGLVIEKARPIGAVPLKRIARAESASDRTSRESGVGRIRALD